jgi:lysozyme family protein
MANFTLALNYTLRHEGGWSFHRDDPGGATNYGITFATAQRHGITTIEGLRDITRAKVADIYRKDYWRFDGVKCQAVAAKVFDMCVNMGLATGVKLAQRALNERLDAGLAEDGVFGPRTLDAMNRSHSPTMLLAKLCILCEEHYRGIVKRRPNMKVFLNGWLRRAWSLPEH